MEASRKNEFLVGIFVLFGLIMTGAIILQFGSVLEAFRHTYRLKVTFPNAPGVKQGSPVFLGGSRIGRVAEHPVLKPDSSGVIIEMEIYKDKFIPIDASFAVGTVGLMGDALIEIRIAESDQPITDFYPFDHTEIIEGDKSDGLAGLPDRAASAAKKIDSALDDVKLALTDVKAAMKKINEGALSDSVVQDFRSSMEHLNSTMTRIDENVLGEDNATALKTAINNIKDASESFKRSAGNMETVTGKLDAKLDKLDPVLEKADTVMASADQALSSIKKGADDFSAVARAMRTGKGLLPALLDDPELKNEFSDLISNLKRRGFLFYRDSAGREDEAPTSGATPDSRRQLFKR
jgi:phospholipid/cholesterol/gamma-HCH transport system substrate-binding protein